MKRIRGSAFAIVAAATLAGAGLAACGSVVAGNSGNSGNPGNDSTTGTASGAASAAGAAGTAIGCAATGDATKVTTLRAMHLVEPTRLPSEKKSDTNPAQVQALFRDLCNVVHHPPRGRQLYECPMDIGLAYSGTFYAGSRVLASYTYEVSGCQRVTVTNGPHGKLLQSIVEGTAAKSAPALELDLAKVVGLPVSELFHPLTTQVNQGK